MRGRGAPRGGFSSRGGSRGGFSRGGGRGGFGGGGRGITNLIINFYLGFD